MTRSNPPNEESDLYDPLRLRAGEIGLLAEDMLSAEARCASEAKVPEARFLPEALPVEMSPSSSGSRNSRFRSWLVACDGGKLILAHGVFLHVGTSCDMVIVLPDGERVSLAGKVTAVSHVKGRIHRVEVWVQSNHDVSSLLDVDSIRTRTKVKADPAVAGVIGPEGLVNNQRLRGRVLLAEDTPDTQGLFSLFLKKAGAEVSIAANGAIALDMLDAAEREGRPYRLLLTDIQMPELDGHSLVRIVRSKNKVLPIVAVTALVTPEDREQCMASGCSDYAEKPIDRPELVAICSRWLKA